MSAVLEPMGPSTGVAGWLDKERTIAGAGFNRWLVPPAALTPMALDSGSQNTEKP